MLCFPTELSSPPVLGSLADPAPTGRCSVQLATEHSSARERSSGSSRQAWLSEAGTENLMPGGDGLPAGGPCMTTLAPAHLLKSPGSVMLRPCCPAARSICFYSFFRAQAKHHLLQEPYWDFSWPFSFLTHSVFTTTEQASSILLII